MDHMGWFSGPDSLNKGPFLAEMIMKVGTKASFST